MTSSVEGLLRIDCGTGVVTESREIVDDMIAHGRSVLEAHSNCEPGNACDDKWELLDMHLESNFPDVNDVIRGYAVDELLADDLVSENTRK